MIIIQSAIDQIIPQSSDHFTGIVRSYTALSPKIQEHIRTQLTGYFLERNPKP